MTRFLCIVVPLLVATGAFAESADLTVGGFSVRPFQLSFSVANHGPDAARNVVLTMDVPDELSITDAGFGSQKCDTTRRPVRCELGDLARGQSRFGTLDLIAPIADATWTVTLTASSATPDPNPANQIMSRTWSTTREAGMSVSVFPAFARADPGSLIRHTWSVCNEVPGSAFPDEVRVDFSVTNGVIEAIDAPPFACTIDGASATCVATGLTRPCRRDFTLAVRASSDRTGAATRVVARVSSSVPERDPSDDEDVASTPVHRWIAVTNTNDSGPGSLRDAFEQANELCSPGPCRIVFEIPPPVPAEGWFTITPETPLPELTAHRVRLEGSSQTEFTGHTNTKGPEIAIDGRLAGRGLKMLTGCEGVVEGLAIGNFAEDQGLWISTAGFNTPRCAGMLGVDQVEVSFNHIGVDPAGSVPWPNLRGLRADGMAGYVSANRIRFNRHAGVWMWRGRAHFANNWIEHNGAAGIFIGPEASMTTIGNRIADNAQMGVAIAAGAPSVDLRRNSMKNNRGLGIDWELDGVSPVDRDDRTGPGNAPVILYGYYDADSNRTIVAVSVRSAPRGFGSGWLNFYANESADGDGEQHLEQVSTTPNQLVLASLAGDHRGKWINVTWTRMFNPEYGSFQTSELSNTLKIE
jgi:hypothetical protein